MRFYGLCTNRRPMPTNEFIFDKVEDMFDFESLEEIAANKLKEADGEVAIYVTGLSMLLVAALNAAAKLDLDVELYHYNKDTKGYEVQKIWKS